MIPTNGPADAMWPAAPRIRHPQRDFRHSSMDLRSCHRQHRRPMIGSNIVGKARHGTQYVIAFVALGALVALLLASSVRVVQQYQRGVHFRLGRVIAVREPGLRIIIPVVDRLVRVSLRIVTMPIQSQGIITRDNVSVDIAAVAYFRVTDARKAVIAIENVATAIDQIAQTTLRNVVGTHSLDEVLAETSEINDSIRVILDTTTLEWGVEVTLVELKDIQLPDSMKRAMARTRPSARSAPRLSPPKARPARQPRWATPRTR